MKYLQVLVFSSLFLVPVGCNRDKPVSTLGVDAIASDMLRGISQNRPGQVYKAYFSSELQRELPLKKWTKTAEDYRERLGSFVSLERTTGWAQRIAGRGEGQVEYRVEWEKAKGSLILNITEEGDWKIRSFEIRSGLFQKIVREDELEAGADTKPASPPQGTPETMPA